MMLELAAYHYGVRWRMYQISLAKAMSLKIKDVAEDLVGAPQYWWYTDDGLIDWWPQADADFEVRQCKDGTGIWTPAKRLSSGMTT
jgi:hypothetical protein